MSILLRIPKTLFSSNAYRITSAHEIPLKASYSINSAHQNRSNPFFHLNSVPKSYLIVPTRQKSFTAIAADIYANISQSSAVATLQNALISYHDFTGLPWWATIITYTICLRLVTFPFVVYTHKIKARLDNIMNNELPAIGQSLQASVSRAKHTFKLSDRKATVIYRGSFKEQYKELIERDNCHPFKMTITLWMQIPIWICQSIAFRNLVSLQPDPTAYSAILAFNQLTVGGFLWIPNLLEADASYIVPVMMSLMNLANIELLAMERADKPSSKFATVITSVFRAISIAMIPVAASVPSCLALYWCASTTCALIQNLVVLSPKAKRAFGIPTKTTYHMEQPYRTIANRFVQQMEKRKNWCTSLISRDEKKL